MKLFSSLYHKVMSWARHPHAPYYLGVISFTESSFFPIPPDVMLAPMSLARPNRALWYATLTTIASVLGALFGYVIGLFGYDLIYPWVVKLGYADAYTQAEKWFGEWGGWVMLIVAFSPIPFKVFTVAGGALHIPLLPFVLGSLIGRGARFYLVSGLMMWGGEKMDRLLKKTVDWLGWVLVAVLVIAYLIYLWLS